LPHAFITLSVPHTPRRVNKFNIRQRCVLLEYSLVTQREGATPRGLR